MKGIAILVLAMLAAPAIAQAQMYKCVDESGSLSFSDSPCKAVPASSRKTSESLSANVLMVRSHSDIENWVKTEPAKRRGDVGRMRTITRGTKIYMPVVATFSQSQEGQRIGLVADFEISGPGGKTQKITSCCLANRVDPRAPATIVLGPVVDLTFDATDPDGEYRVRVMINNGRETVVAEEKFRLQ